MANLKLVPQSPATTAIMTSVELVEYINSEREELANASGVAFPSKGFAKLEHSDFLKKVPEVLGADAGKISGIYRDSMNREKPCYHFQKREACLMAMSYSYDLQAKVFDKMTALEGELAKSVFRIPQTLSEALRLAADQQDQIEAQKIELKKAEPKVELVDNFLATNSGVTGGEAAKELAKEFNIGRNRLYKFLQKHHVFDGKNKPYQQHIDAKRFYLQPVLVGGEISKFTVTEPMFTQKGVFFCRHLLRKFLAEDIAA